MYENGRITRAAESDIVINSEGIITKRTLTRSIIYSYDKDGNLIKKVISSQDKAKPDCTISYEHYGDSGVVSHTECKEAAFTSRDGTKILSEKWGSNTLTPLYDNKDEVCGIVFNGASYYFLKNLQGDVISISKAYNIFCRRLLPEATELCKIYL